MLILNPLTGQTVDVRVPRLQPGKA